MYPSLWLRPLVLSVCALTWAASASAQQSTNAVMSDAVHRLASRYDSFAMVPDDPRGRVVYGTSRGRLHLLEHRRNRYQEIWVSPSLVTRVSEVCVADLRGDGRYAIIAYNARGYLYIFDLDDYSLIWQTPETQFRSIEAMTVGQADRDPQQEILFLSEGILYIYDGQDFVEEWRSDVIYEAADVAIGDVDGDGNAEIVLSSGHVLDAWSRTLEWEAPDPFGDHIELADIDGDGRLELIAGSGGTAVIYEVDERREKWD